MQLVAATDPELSGDVELDGEGATDLPYCGHVVLAGLELTEAGRTIAACLVSSGAYTEAPSLSITLVFSGVVHVRVGPEQTERDVSFQTGLTLVGALREVFLEGHAPSLIGLEREGKGYVIDMAAILDGRRKDEPLLPNDTLSVKEELPMRPSPAQRAIARTRLGTFTPVPPDATCGDVVLEDAELRSSGKGARHHEVLAVDEAIAARCAGDEDRAAASLVDACRDARRREAELLASGSPLHPKVRALRASLLICPPEPTASAPGAPSAADCAALRSERGALRWAGKGERHPAVMALDARLARCPR